MDRDLIVSLAELQELLDRGTLSTLQVINAELKVTTTGNVVAVVKRSVETPRKF